MGKHEKGVDCDNNFTCLLYRLALRLRATQTTIHVHAQNPGKQNTKAMAQSRKTSCAQTWHCNEASLHVFAMGRFVKLGGGAFILSWFGSSTDFFPTDLGRDTVASGTAELPKSHPADSGAAELPEQQTKKPRDSWFRKLLSRGRFLSGEKTSSLRGCRADGPSHVGAKGSTSTTSLGWSSKRSPSSKVHQG